MFKYKILLFVTIVSAVLFLHNFKIFAQTQEELTITTYYPSPTGMYNQLQANRLAIGDTNENGKMDIGDLPSENGQLHTSRSIIYKPLTALPAVGSREGELVYNGNDKSFYYYDGSAWVKQSSGGRVCIEVYGNNPATNPSCPVGWTDEGNLGIWGYCAVATPPGPGGGVSLVIFPPGGRCGGGGGLNWHTDQVGRTTICCRN